MSIDWKSVKCKDRFSIVMNSFRVATSRSFWRGIARTGRHGGGDHRLYVTARIPSPEFGPNVGAAPPRIIILFLLLLFITRDQISDPERKRTTGAVIMEITYGAVLLRLLHVWRSMVCGCDNSRRPPTLLRGCFFLLHSSTSCGERKQATSLLCSFFPFVGNNDGVLRCRRGSRRPTPLSLITNSSNQLPGKRRPLHVCIEKWFPYRRRPVTLFLSDRLSVVSKVDVSDRKCDCCRQSVIDILHSCHIFRLRR
jgi:hypothetical protein